MWRRAPWRFFAVSAWSARCARPVFLPTIPTTLFSCTTAIGIEFSRIPIPCRAERYTAKGGPDTWWPTPEPAHRINQIFLEPVLFAHAVATSRLSILNRTRVVDYVQSESGVRATAENLDNGGVSEIFATYLIGCDGLRCPPHHGRQIR